MVVRGRGPGDGSLHSHHSHRCQDQHLLPVRREDHRGPGGGRHLPRHAGHDSPVVHTPGEEQVGQGRRGGLG